jgi:DNA invertase Pin-like site-specific DNA recombinase
MSVHFFGALADFERSIIPERTMAGLKSARDRGKLGSRPRALDDDDKAAPRTMLRNPEITVNEIACRLSVSPATLYRHSPGGRSRIIEGGANG